MVITSGRFGRDLFGDVFVVAEVRGAWGSRAAPFVSVDARFVGAAGEVLGTESSYINGRSRRLALSRIVDDATLAAGENGCVYIATDIPYARVSQVSVATSWSTSQLEVLRGTVTVQSIQQDADSLGNLRVRGQARNAGTNTTYFNQVLIAARTSADALIDCDYTFVDGTAIRLPSGVITQSGLTAGQVAPFVNSGRPRFSEVGRLEAWTAWDEEDAGSTIPTAMPVSWRRLITRDLDVTDDRKDRVRLRNTAIDALRLRDQGLSAQ